MSTSRRCELHESKSGAAGYSPLSDCMSRCQGNVTKGHKQACLASKEVACTQNQECNSKLHCVHKADFDRHAESVGRLQFVWFYISCSISLVDRLDSGMLH